MKNEIELFSGDQMIKEFEQQSTNFYNTKNKLINDYNKLFESFKVKMNVIYYKLFQYYNIIRKLQEICLESDEITQKINVIHHTYENEIKYNDFCLKYYSNAVKSNSIY